MADPIDGSQSSPSPVLALSAQDLVGLLAEEDRRRVVAALILDAADIDQIMAVTGLDRRSVVQAVDRLTTAGLVESGADGVLVVLGQAFKAAARAAVADEPARAGGERSDADEAARLLAECVVDGRLIRLPRKRAKRLIVLDHLAQSFEPGQHYSERQVNAILASFDPDVATLRRYLVDEYFLDRADGSYWRSGGSVDLPSEPAES